MKKVKRESVRKIEINQDPLISSRYRLGVGTKQADLETVKNSSSSKSYRITTAESQRLVTSPGLSKLPRNSAYDPSVRKLSAASDYIKNPSTLV
jgi:hypothetical protein